MPRVDGDVPVGHPGVGGEPAQAARVDRLVVVDDRAGGPKPNSGTVTT
jgi:hypothetical protein